MFHAIWLETSETQQLYCKVFMIGDEIFMLASVQIDLPSTMTITNGLPGKFTAVQMHLHWGGLDLEESGAEHTIDGSRYMAEVGGRRKQQ